MPSGARALASASAGAKATGGGKSDSPPPFILNDRDFAIVRFLATGEEDDPFLGSAQVHGDKFFNRASRGWESCPTSFDDPEGKCNCRNLRDDQQPSYRFGVYMYVLAQYHFKQPTGNNGQTASWAKDWQAVNISQALVHMMNDPQDMNTVDKGVRYFQDRPGFKVWFRGPGKDGYYTERLWTIASMMPNQNLSAKNVLIARKPDGKIGLHFINGRIEDVKSNGEISNPVITLDIAPDGIVECNVPLNDTDRAKMMRLYDALPPVREFFLDNFKWPLFKDEDSEAVDEGPQPPVVMQQPVAAPPAPVYEAPAPVAEAPVYQPPVEAPVAVAPPPVAAVPDSGPRHAPPPPTPVPPSDIASEGLERFEPEATAPRRTFMPE